MITSDKIPKIVIIDPDMNAQEMTAAYFKSKRYQVIGFKNVESALKESLKTGSEWDVLISELQFPETTWVDLVMQFKRNLPHLPIIAVTTLNSAEDAIQALHRGVSDYIVKPTSFLKLQLAIDKVLKTNSNGNNTFSAVSAESPNVQDKIIGRSQNFLEALNIAKRVAKSSANIFITGESGTGKEVIARFIHSESKQHKGPFVAINCSAIPESLLESELFGHAKGSFTGAQEKRVGLFEEAQEGTLFLDEIGDLNLPLQAKLLRVLQEKKIKRVGENQYRSINCRIISATHKSLKQEVQENRFREDLLFRLDVIPINIPPLRQRTEDILLLAEFFLKKFSFESASPPKIFSKEAVSYLLENKWRGNVRELENTIERAVVLSETNEIRVQDFLPKLSEFTLTSQAQEKVNVDPNIFSINCAQYLPTLEEVINKYLDFAVKKNDGARDRTAKAIGIDRKTLYKRIKLTELRMPVNYSQ